MRFLNVWLEDGSSYQVRPGEEPFLEVSVSRFLATGQDELVRLCKVDGDEWVVRASSIMEWVMSTPEGRDENVRLRGALNREMAEAEKQHCLSEDEEWKRSL